MTKIVICGALGRMGTTIGKLVNDSPDLTLVGGIDIVRGQFFGVEVVPATEIGSLLEKTTPDILIDFTAPDPTVEHVKSAASHNVGLIIGTTGLVEAQVAEIKAAIEGKVPAVMSSNYSIGVNIFWQLIREAAQKLSTYDIEVLEAHHRYKKDAPSGTAKTILSIIDKAVGERKKVYGREGICPRGEEIGVHAIRGGDIVGDHTVMFTGNYETITLSHSAYDRAVFASGALLAAKWIIGKKPGLYGMNDVLGL